jgi:SpoVK/Ycf46/Vps4 family AAA+-type ATPase
LDSAIRRAGRFDQHIPVMPPDSPSRVAILVLLFKKFDADRNTRFSTRLQKRDMSVIANQTSLFTFPELQALVSDVLSFLPSNATKQKIKEELLTLAKSYSRATSFSSYNNRKGAEREIAILVSTISQAEFQKFSNRDKEDFLKLLEKVGATEFKNLIPSWTSKRTI